MNGQSELTKDGSELVDKMLSSNLNAVIESVNPVRKGNYENKIICQNKDCSLVNINCNGLSYRVSISYGRDNFKKANKQIKKFLGSI